VRKCAVHRKTMLRSETSFLRSCKIPKLVSHRRFTAYSASLVV